MGLVAIIRSWMLVILVLLLEEWATLCHGCSEHERTALLEIKPFFSLPSPLYGGGAESPWGIDADCCNWAGVVCNETTNRVTELYLSQSVDTGSGGWYLNASLFLPFKDLTSLFLSENKILGCIENEGFEKLSRLAHLETLYLASNEFNSSIMSSLGGLSSLKTLSLYNNNIKGKVDIQGFEKLSRLAHLETLDLGDNEFNSSILSSLGGLSSLKTLHLSYNRIKGKVDIQGFEKLSRLAHLETLDLGYNELNSSILSSLRGLSSLKTLYLNNNSIKGKVDIHELHTLSRLEMLDLSENEITGFVATADNQSWSNCSVLYLGGIRRDTSPMLELQSLHDFFPNLRSLYLTSYNLQGRSFGSYHLNNLQELDLDYSTVDDNFIQSIRALVSLRNLSINNLNASQLTQGWPHLKSLKKLNLDKTTTLNHKMLQTMGNLTSLEELSMQNCSLSGPIPKVQGICELNQLKYLDISLNNLSGTLPPCMANLTSLRQLNLDVNQLTGNISLSPLRTLTSLESLYLSDNQFQIPVTLSPFFNHTKLYSLFAEGNNIFAETEQHSLAPKFQLTELSLSGYGYGGAFPKFLYYQRNLTYVDLSDIQLRGGFPYWLLENNTGLDALYLVNNSLSGQLRLPSHSNMSLAYLDISGNCLCGHVPALIGAYLSNLQYLNMSSNNFNGRVPPFSNISSIQTLDLSNNGLSGELPGQLATSCNFLSLSNNSLQGQIPNSLFNSSSLIILDLSHNNIHGKLPRWTENMNALRVLDLSNNSISGSLPSNFPSSIEQVYLSKNKLQGPLKKAFHNNSNLVILDLGHNYFNGRIPKWIDTFSNLSYLILDNNYFEGEIPIQLCNLGKISLIDFSHNYLSGHILPCLRSRSNWDRTHTIESYSYSFNYSSHYTFQPRAEFTTKSFSYSYEGRLLSFMSGIDLSCNKLTGEISPKLGNLHTIKVLNLSHNSLTGPIPSTFSNLEDIESLDLSFNNLDGKIPPQLTQLNQLEVFTVAHNNLFGKTPDMVKQFATFESTSYEDNPLLCGPPLKKSCDARPQSLSSSKSSSEHEEETGLIDMDAFYPSFLASYSVMLLGLAAVLYINPHWRGAWFYFVGECINNCFYFIVDNLPMLSKYKAWQPYA